MVKGSASPDDPALAGYWAEPATEGQTPAGWIHDASARQAERALPAVRGSSPDRRTAPESPQAWERWWLQLARRAISADTSPITGNPGRRTMTRPASYTLPVTAGTSPASAGNRRFNLQRPRGLLEPCAAMSGTHGSEGGAAGQPAGPTRHPYQLTATSRRASDLASGGQFTKLRTSVLQVATFAFYATPHTYARNRDKRHVDHTCKALVRRGERCLLRL